MSYFPGHNYFLRFAESSGNSVNESTGALMASTAIAAADDIGYTSPNSVTHNEGTKIGYAAGRRTGSYAARGNRVHTLTAELKLGSLDFIKDNCVQMNDALPWLDLYYGVSNQWSRGLYSARCSKVSLNFQEGEAQELTASATFEAIASAEAPTIITAYDYQEFGPALLWTDVRQFSVNGTAIRDKVTSLSVDIDHQLERKGMRPDFGDNVPGSRTSYSLLPHHAAVTGSLALHDLPTIEAQLFTSGANAMQWSDIVVQARDVANTTTYNVTIVNPRPTGRTQDATGSEAQMAFTVPFVADKITIG